MVENNNFEKFYKSIGKVFCPYFNEYVFFTELGFEHLRFKNKNKARNSKDRDVRMSLIPTAINIINITRTLQDKISRNRFEERLINNRSEFAMTLVTYYEFLALVNNKKIKIIIKEIAGKDKVFLSVIPLYKQKSPPIEGDGFS